MVTCATCSHFTRDTIGDGTGIGDCFIYNKNKHNQRWLAELQKTLGMNGFAQVLWPNTDRDCQRFEGVNTNP